MLQVSMVPYQGYESTKHMFFHAKNSRIPNDIKPLSVNLWWINCDSRQHDLMTVPPTVWERLDLQPLDLQSNLRSSPEQRHQTSAFEKCQPRINIILCEPTDLIQHRTFPGFLNSKNAYEYEYVYDMPTFWRSLFTV